MPLTVLFFPTALYASAVLSSLIPTALSSSDLPKPAPQSFSQQIAERWPFPGNLEHFETSLVEAPREGTVRVYGQGTWLQLTAGKWESGPEASADGSFMFPDLGGRTVRTPIPWAQVLQLQRHGPTNYVVSTNQIVVFPSGESRISAPQGSTLRQVALSHAGELYVACTAGLFRRVQNSWERIEALDAQGRSWTASTVLGVGFDTKDQLWICAPAGIGCLTATGWRFYGGKDGVPWTEFTGLVAVRQDEVWFGTRLGAIKYDGSDFHYYQGPRWLPHDHVESLFVDSAGTAWFATPGGLGCIKRKPMSLAQKADFFEEEIENYIKRTPFGYVAEAPLGKPGDRSTANPQDSDNDGLWTAMYGAGECFAFAATHAPKAKQRARQAFEALRFLQKVTQGCDHAPPHGYVARTIRPVEWPDPNIGRLEADRESQKSDQLWKAYEPRWPKSADGKWYWKSDTSSDELDGHFFFYPLYFDFCADTEEERERVREVVRDLADHLLKHRFVLIDHDGKPTRWAVYGPQFLNSDPRWWVERGLNSLSILSYLAVAGHVTGDPKYEAASRELVSEHGYAQNAMHAKAQHGPGSGNQSDDEMAYMCYYSLLRCSKDEALKQRIRYSLYLYWVNDAPEVNPLFNFIYAALNLNRTGATPYGTFDLNPWRGWHDDAMTTLYRFPLDRVNWPHRNSHRLDLALLPPTGARDIEEPGADRSRGARVNGKVLPVENRHFGHWNTDPWQLDYDGNGNELAAGTVFLLPYYLGLYHNFIEKPTQH